MHKLPRNWPEGRSLAVTVSVMLEAWGDGVAPGIGPMGNPLKAGVLDLQARSWAAYGPRTGTWRLLDVLAAAKVRAVFYVSGIIAEREPALLKAIVEAGHEVAGHSWSQDIVPATQSREDEAADLQRCISATTQATGKPLLGWISPRCTPSASTTELLADSGFTWHGDFFDADLPRVIETAKGRIVAMPFSMEVNDLPLTIRYGNAPEAFMQILERTVTQWPTLPASTACMDITVHAHIFGRPAGAIELAKSLEIVRRCSDWAWLTDHAQLARDSLEGA
ncbi:polysaccharide deacetylase family protein [Undibacterium sp. TJN25]|uniref:polysaccharide deacetylase family protein n=1 Tax=Undibacterium sp. TJN25 TaxID=3413056 RepID=UPI003BF0EE68